ncbi:NUDIX domain-containing protein [Streptomyces sp. NPDC051561]|uniref:NUDIX domain-containing protein n=1 Tax=Streptomyces sp. NPDC051561 TaxID=3365658 RepID=UPI0037AD66CD
MIAGHQRLAADVVQILLRENGTVLCVQRSLGADRMPGPLALIGGPLLASEALDGAARREAQEQAGVQINALDQEFVGLLHQHVPERMDRVTVVFVAQTWAGEPYSAELHEQQELFWVSIDNPPPNCDADTAAVLRLLTAGPSYQALNWPSTGGTS